MTLELLTRDTVTADVSTETKRQLIAQDMQMWRNTRWQAEMRLRGAQRVGNVERKTAYIKTIEECEGELMHLEDELKALAGD